MLGVCSGLKGCNDGTPLMLTAIFLMAHTGKEGWEDGGERKTSSTEDVVSLIKRLRQVLSLTFNIGADRAWLPRPGSESKRNRFITWQSLFNDAGGRRIEGYRYRADERLW